MKKLLTIAILFLASANVFADTRNLDSLKSQLQLTKNDSLKGGIYQAIATQYLQYDTIKHSGVKRYYQDEALNYTMLALHNYSYYDDTLGMRTCFDYLSKVYQSQGKLAQAKWFVLQSNKISRDRKDIDGIVNSLVRLSSVKMSNKDYKLAMRDLNEALVLSTKNKLTKLEALVQKNYAYLYNRMGDTEKGDLASKRASELNDQVLTEDQLRSTAMAATPDTAKVKVVLKKKVAVSTTAKKMNKLNAAKRYASL
ncbi:hypothetical protein [Mucilaginibacter glaciei]|uniref:Tetratricopeptide repeat protein n=1 Tax=Mucilaginibacter glaciei TaxID=2772109 RepID=A0A926NNE0_9SPHI|nr:hypothetical protein [Mucilaginibacter glaciei]MBD1391717.1 hypothetical protein [Mucilaginibacter glaciei]